MIRPFKTRFCCRVSSQAHLQPSVQAAWRFLFGRLCFASAKACSSNQHKWPFPRIFGKTVVFWGEEHWYKVFPNLQYLMDWFDFLTAHFKLTSTVFSEISLKINPLWWRINAPKQCMTFNMGQSILHDYTIPYVQCCEERKPEIFDTIAVSCFMNGPRVAPQPPHLPSNSILWPGHLFLNPEPQTLPPHRFPWFRPKIPAKVFHNKYRRNWGPCSRTAARRTGRPAATWAPRCRRHRRRRCPGMTSRFAAARCRSSVGRSRRAGPPGPGRGNLRRGEVNVESTQGGKSSWGMCAYKMHICARRGQTQIQAQCN